MAASISAATLTDAGTLVQDGSVAAITTALVAAGATLIGYGSFLNTTTDDGPILATNGLLKLAAVTGTGALQIGNAASLELTAATRHRAPS